MAKPFIVVTGCGSSGTKFAARAWRTAGVHVGHERGGAQGVSSWYVAPGLGARFHLRGIGYPPFNAMAWEGIDRVSKDRGVICFHQTRQPIKAISTVQRYSRPSWLYIIKTLQREGIEIAMDTPKIRRCMLYWYWWNLLAEKRACYQYRIEDFTKPEIWEHICRLAGRPEKIEMLEKIKGIPKTVNSRKRKYKPMSWAQLYAEDTALTEKIKELGRTYGYNIR